GEIRVAPDRVVIERFACLMGGEPAALGGEVRRDEHGEVELDLRLSGESAALVQTADVRVRADFAATLTGPVTAPVLGGRVAITNALLSGDIAVVGRGPGVGDDRFQLFALRGPWARLRFDLRVSGAQSLIVDNNLLDGAFSLDLHIRGTGEAPTPAGLLTARRGTRVKLPFSTLQMQRIELRFPEDDPFRPRVDASGSASFAGQAGSGRIEVRVLAAGPYDQVQITTTSEPPLSEDDRLSLLTTGATRSSIEGNPGRRALGMAGGYLFNEVKRWVSGPSNPDADPGFFDRFDLQVGDELSRSGNEVVETEFRIDNRGHWFLSGERDRFDALNTGVIYRFSFR
nr:translocation/assembly module TamB domain-containing protein [Planctomycetota bacterium]